MFKIQTLNNISQQRPRPVAGESRIKVGNDIADPDAVLVRSADMHVADRRAVDQSRRARRCRRQQHSRRRIQQRGVPVFNAPGANANAVKELVVAGMLISARNLERCARRSSAS